MIARRARRGYRTAVMAAALAASVAGAAAIASPVAAQQTHLLIVTGLGGTPEYTASFARLGGRLAEAAVGVQGVPEENVIWLAERADVGRGVDGPSRRDTVSSAILGLAERSNPGDVVAIVLFGHGSARGDETRINLPGPDLSGAELAVSLGALPDRRVVVVNGASASGGWVEPLSAPGRVVITATRNAVETEATRFGEHFVAAFEGDAADTDKDGVTSMLEAFEYARTEVARAFEEAGNLATEHALLDDDGDGVGSMAPVEAEEGDLARRITLAPALPAAAADDPELERLYAEKARLEQELESLRARKDEMEGEAYQAELERLLLEIAANGRAIREKQGGTNDRDTGQGGSAAPGPGGRDA